MTEAIATTKRKFYKALDALASQPTSRPPTKRVRRDLSSASSSITSLRPTKVEGADPENRDLPNFSPWSHEAFLVRLKSFSSVSTWHPKPDEIGEVEWAKRGWVCVDVNTVGCRGGCGRRVVVDMGVPSKEEDAHDTGDEEQEREDEDAAEHDRESFEEMLAQRYKTMIAEGHSEGCLWRRDGCKNDIYRVQVVRPTVWQPELRKRYLSLLEITDSIKDVKTTPIVHDTPNILKPERLLQELPQQILVSPSGSPSSETATKALEIALHGWRGSSETGNDLLHCDTCFQRIGLWMYQPGYKPFHARSSDDEPTEEDDDPLTIDLAEIHRDYCPWRNPNSQKAAGSLSGLNASQILQRVVSTCAREQRRKSDQNSKDKATPALPDEEHEGDVDGSEMDAVPFSRTEIDAQDKERESRLRRLKSLFNIKRRSATTTKTAASAWKPHM